MTRRPINQETTPTTASEWVRREESESRRTGRQLSDSLILLASKPPDTSLSPGPTTREHGESLTAQCKADRLPIPGEGNDVPRLHLPRAGRGAYPEVWHKVNVKLPTTMLTCKGGSQPDAKETLKDSKRRRNSPCSLFYPLPTSWILSSSRVRRQRC
jgi:hypothetical protein